MEWSPEAIALIIGAATGGIVAIIQALKISKKVSQIDAAVNGKAPGETTMVSQVQDIHDAMPTELTPPTPVAVLPLVQQIHAHLFDPENGGTNNG